MGIKIGENFQEWQIFNVFAGSELLWYYSIVKIFSVSEAIKYSRGNERLFGGP